MQNRCFDEIEARVQKVEYSLNPEPAKTFGNAYIIQDILFQKRWNERINAFKKNLSSKKSIILSKSNQEEDRINNLKKKKKSIILNMKKKQVIPPYDIELKFRKIIIAAESHPKPTKIISDQTGNGRTRHR